MPFSDKAKNGLTAFIRRVVGLDILGPRMDYLGTFKCRVVSQNSDGSLELRPDDQRLPGYSKVPIRWPFPSSNATVSAGARAYLEFASGDPQQPFVSGFDLTSSLLVLNLGGTSGLQGCGLGDQIATALSNIVSFLTTHTHGGVTVGGGTSGVSLTTPPTIGTVSSSVVKVKP